MGQFALILAVALATYTTRIAGFFLGDRALPPRVHRYLAYVPIAVFAALIAPDAGLGTPQMVPRLVGLAAAALVVLRWNQLWAGLGAGMIAYWIVRFLV
jgi:uncharacterized membrane protein